MGLRERKQINNLPKYKEGLLHMPIGDESWGNAATGAANLVTNTMNSFGPVKSSNTLMAEAGTSTGYGSGFTYQRQDPVNSAAQMSELSQETTSNALKTAAAGASLGATFGPIGAGIGVVAGGVLGLIGGAARKRKLINEMKDAKVKTGYVNEFNLASGQSDFLESDYNTKYNTTQNDQIFSAARGKMPGEGKPNAMVSNGEIIGHVDNQGNVVEAYRVGQGKDNKDTVPVHLKGGDRSFVLTNKQGISDYVAATGDVKGGLQMQKNMKEYQRYKQLWNGRLPKFIDGIIGSDVDTRSDTTWSGYHEGDTPWNAGNIQTSPLDALNMVLNYNVTNNPNIITGEAPGVSKWAKIQEVLAARKAAAAAKTAKPAVRVGRSPYEGLTAEQIEAKRQQLSASGKLGGQASALTRNDRVLSSQIRAEHNRQIQGMVNANKEASKLNPGSKPTVFNNGKKTYNTGAITSYDLDPYKHGKLPKYDTGLNPFYNITEQDVINAAKAYNRELGGNSFIKPESLMPKAQDWEDYKRLIGGTTDGSIDDYIRKQDDYDDNIGSKRTSWLGPAALSALGIATAYGMKSKGNPYISNTYAENPYEQQIRSAMASRRPNILDQITAVRDAEARNRYTTKNIGTSIGAYIPAAISQGIGTQKNIAGILASGNNLRNQYIGDQANMDAQLGSAIAQRRMNSNQFRDTRYDRAASMKYTLDNNAYAQMLGQAQYGYKNIFDLNKWLDTMGLYNRDYALRRDELNRRAIA